MTLLILELLFIHWIADFVLQSDWMARNKSKEMLPLVLHCGTYFLTLWFLLLFCVSRCEWGDCFIFAWINTVLHFVVDYITSRINAYLWAKGSIHNFFVMVGGDQVIHQICLISTAYWMFT